AQRGHAVELKRQVVDRVRMWCAFEEPDDDRAVREPDGLTGPEHFLQIEVLRPKLRALLRVSDGKAEMPHRAKSHFHVRPSSRALGVQRYDRFTRASLAERGASQFQLTLALKPCWSIAPIISAAPPRARRERPLRANSSARSVLYLRSSKDDRCWSYGPQKCLVNF